MPLRLGYHVWDSVSPQTKTARYLVVAPNRRRIAIGSPPQVVDAPSHSRLRATANGTAVSDMVVDADALADGLRAVHLAGPTRAMDEQEVRDASWIRARDRAANGDDEDFSAGTASESDWSDAELREADSKGDSDKPPSAAQGSGRPWAHVSRARAARRRERRAAVGEGRERVARRRLGRKRRPRAAEDRSGPK